MEFLPSDEVRRIKSRLDHPIIDSDGHAIEYLPVVRDILREQAGEDAVTASTRDVRRRRAMRDAHARADARAGCSALVVVGPARAQHARPRHRAAPGAARRAARRRSASTTRCSTRPTASVPPSSTTPTSAARWRARSTPSTRRRSATIADLLTPVGIIPMHTPEEAIAELELRDRRARARRRSCSAGRSPRPAPGVDAPRRAPAGSTRSASTALYDYDPVWPRCVELGVSPTFHTAVDGVGDARVADATTSTTTSACSRPRGEALARSLFLGGVPHRFPTLRFAFQEGGVRLGGSLCYATSSATGRSATATRSVTTTRRTSTASCSPSCSASTARSATASASTSSTTGCAS